jgi:hypothetical protein
MVTQRNLHRSIVRSARADDPFVLHNEEFPRHKPGIIYVRQSTEYQRDHNIHSYEMQTELFLKFFREQLGCTGKIDIIPDEEKGHTSGTQDIHERPGLKEVDRRLTSENPTDEVGWLGAIAVNRFTRDQWLITPGVLMKHCYQKGVWVRTLKESFNFHDEQSQHLFLLEAEEAARHLTWMKSIMGGAKRVASDNGYYDGRWVAPGYIVDRSDEDHKKYILYEPHMKVVLWLFERFYELDANFPELCREVDAMPYLFPKFESWVEPKNVRRLHIGMIKEGKYAGYYKPSTTGLKSILTNPVYLGWWIPIDGGVLKENHPAILKGEKGEFYFWFAHSHISPYDINGIRQKPLSIIRNGDTDALLKKVMEDGNGNKVYASAQSREGADLYFCVEAGALTNTSLFSVNVPLVDGAFLPKFFERLRGWQVPPDWKKIIQEHQRAKEQSDVHIRSELEQAQADWDYKYKMLTNRNQPKTARTIQRLTQECTGLEQKIAEYEALLNEPVDQDELVQHQVIQRLPEVIAQWPQMLLKDRLRIIGAFVDVAILCPVAPSWIKLEIHWKRQEWGIDVAHMRRKAHQEWTPQEEEILGKIYATARIPEMLEALPLHPWYAIRVHAGEMELRRPRHGANENVHRFHPCFADTKYAQENGLDINQKNAQWQR